MIYLHDPHTEHTENQKREIHFEGNCNGINSHYEDCEYCKSEAKCTGNEKLCKCMDCSYNRAEERYLKMCLEMDEGQPNNNDDGWE